MKTKMKYLTQKSFLTIVLLVSAISAKSANLDSIEAGQAEDMSIEFIQDHQDVLNGTLVQADDTYYFFQNNNDESLEIVPRSHVQYLETNMNVNLQSVFAGKDAVALRDVIELNDGTKIPSVILDIGPQNIQYFSGKSMKRESIPTSSIYMVYIDNAAINIPFPQAL